MKVYYCNNFKGHWPVGVCALIIAPDPETGMEMLNMKLNSLGLRQGQFNSLILTEVDVKHPDVLVINNGDY